MLTLNVSPHFKRSFKKSPLEVRHDFDRKIDLFATNPFDPSLKTHKLHGKLSEYYSFCLHRGFRVLFRFSKPNEINLLDIDSHDYYKKWR